MALIVITILVIITSVVVLSIADFLSNALPLNISRWCMSEAMHAARAGVYMAIRDYRETANKLYWVKTLAFVNITGGSYYKIGKDSNFLLADTDNPQIANDGSGGIDKALTRISLSNLNETQAITVNRVKLEWANMGSATLNSLVLGSAPTPQWTGLGLSGDTLTLNPQFTLAAKAAAAINLFSFSSAIPRDAVIFATFYFIDGSARKACLYNAGRSGNCEFSITSTGEFRSSKRWKRTIEATYDTSVNRITSWQETGNHL